MARRKTGNSSARYQEDLMEMEREFEEKVVGKTITKRPRRGYPEPPPPQKQRSRKKTKAPLLLRVLAWCGVILLCFVAGYAGTGYMVKIFNLDKQSLLIGKDIASNDVISMLTEEPLEPGAMRPNVQKTEFSVFYMKDGSLMQENLSITSRTLEDNIQEAVLKIFEFSGLSGNENGSIKLLHVFKDVDTVYLDLSSHFIDIINMLGKDACSLLITGITRTMDDNFSLSKVRFLVESKVVNAGVVDLTAVWQLQK